MVIKIQNLYNGILNLDNVKKKIHFELYFIRRNDKKELQ